MAELLRVLKNFQIKLIVLKNNRIKDMINYKNKKKANKRVGDWNSYGILVCISLLWISEYNQ